MEKFNYTIRVTKEQQELIQKYSKQTGLSIADSIDQAITIAQMNDSANIYRITLDELETRIEDLKSRIEEQEKGIKMFSE